MKNINKILAVSFIAMMAVPAAQAKIVSETMLTSEAGHYHKDHTVQDEINAKQDTISDLATIRSGAAKGATSVQSVTQGSTNGTISVDGTNVAVKGLKSAAYTASADYQTAANSKVAAKSSGTYNKITAGNAVNTNLVALDTGIGEINTKIGTVTQGKTVVQMIDEAQAAATPGIATDSATGVVKGGGNVAIANDGTMTVDLSGKADKATTLSGYGITDAYTKTQTNTELAKKVNIDQTSTNAKKVMSTDKDGKVVAGTITGTNGINVTVSDAGAVTVQGTEYSLPVATTTKLGGVKAGGAGITINSTTGVISANTATSGAAGITKVYTETGSNTDGTMTQSAITSALSGKQATLTFDNAPTANSNNPVKSSGIKTYVDNAVAAATPGVATTTKTGVVKGGGNVAIASDGTMSVDLSGKADKATTLAGYGITNAYTKTETDTALDAKQTTANMLAIDIDQGSTLTNTQKESKTTYPSMSTVTAMLDKSSEDLTSAIGKKVDVEQGNGQGGKPDNRNKAMITNASGQVVPGQIATGMIANSAVTTDKINSKAVTAAKIADSTITSTQLADNAVTTAKITAKNVTAPKLADGVVASGSSNVTVTRDSSTGVFSVSVAETNISEKVDKTVSADANGLIVRNASGTAAKGTGTDITVNGTAVTVNHATKADQDGSGQNIANTYATKTEVSNNYATKNMELNTIPATPSTEGVYVLTAKITGSGTNAETTYYWEDIGR